MKGSRGVVKQVRDDDGAIPPVTIFDAEGRVVRVVPATEFQRAAAAARGLAPSAATGDPLSPGRLGRAFRAHAVSTATE